MDSYVFMGMLIAALVVLAGLIAAIIKPVISLNTTVTNLKDSVEKLDGDANSLKDRVTAHGKTLDEHSIKIAKCESSIQHLENDFKHLEGGK